MCLDRENCERVFEKIRILRTFCKVSSQCSSIDLHEMGEVGGEITKLIWKLCSDCRGIFYSKF